jgi:phage-related minor tail protein
MIHKQIQQKMYPRLRERLIETRPPPTGVTNAQVAQGQTELPQTNVPQPHTTKTAHPANDLTELKQIIKTLLDQMGKVINLITALINKNN